MRFKLLGAFAILLIVGSNDARPSIHGIPEVVEEKASTKIVADDSSSLRPLEPTSSSVAKTDSRYRGRTENSKQYRDNYYRSSFTPGILNSFKSDENFGLSSGWQYWGGRKNLSSNLQAGSRESDRLIDEFKSLRFSIAKSKDSSIIDPQIRRNASRQSHNDKFIKLYSPSMLDEKSKSPNNRRGVQDFSKRRNNSNVPPKVSINGKTRVVLKSDYHNPLRYEGNLQPVNLVRPKDRNDTTKHELKNWPNEGIQDVHDLFNYDKYTSSIKKVSHPPSSQTSGDAPIYHITKKKKRKKPGNQTVRPGIIKNQYQNSSPASHGGNQNLTTSTPQSVSSSVTYNREPLMQPNVQEIIHWLQIPAFASIENQSYSAGNVPSGETVTNTFDRPYHELGRPKPVTATTYFQPENDYSGTPLPTQIYTDEIPGMIGNHEPQTQSPKPYEPSDDYGESYHQESESHQQSVTNGYQSENHNHHSESYNESPKDPYQEFGNHNSERPSTTYYVQTPTLEGPSYQGTESTRPVEMVSLPSSVVTLLTDLANKKPTSSRWPIFKPTSEISQNTVVHILNTGSKRPNVTVSEMQVPQVDKPSGMLGTNMTESVTPPNVHIMFMNEEVQGSDKPHSQSIPDVPFQNNNCPTIMINSITRVNNTIESKEGCTDLNIVINSQVLSTNVFKPGSLSQSYADAQDKYAGAVLTESPQDSSSHFENTQNPYTESTPEGTFNSDDEQDADKTDLFENQAVDYEEEGVFTSTSQAVSEIFISTGDPQEEAFDALGGVEPVDGAGVSSIGESAVVGNTPEVLPASIADPGVAVGQAVGGAPAVGQSSGGLPGGASGPISGLAGAAPAGGLPASPASTALAIVDDDDDDDDYDMSPSGLMESMGSVFTYFTFLNPLNYSIFSLAAAPFAAMAAGVLGIAAFFFPWALPGVLDFGRAADRVTIRFKPSLDEVVRQSIHKYRDWHEWKSKRRKRKR